MAAAHYAGWYDDTDLFGDPLPDPILDHLLSTARAQITALRAEEADLRGEVA